MTGLAGTRRGQPLVVLVTLLAAWIGARAMTWESPFPPLAETLEPLMRMAAGSDTLPQPHAAESHRRDAWRSALAAPGPARSLSTPEPLAGQHAALAFSPSRTQTGAVMAGHHLLWLAATASLPVPAELAGRWHAPVRQAGPRHVAVPAGSPPYDRWSFDSWLLLRPDSQGEVTAGILPAGYGASQAGAVARYRLAPDSGHRPTLYARATQALAGGKESELAAGLAARPAPGLPLSLHAEMRAVRGASGQVKLRPAAFAVTELPPARLPLALRGTAYAQAGYVGGEFASAFVDGQALIDREVARFDLGSVRTGAGIWGGAQKGAARLDIGPSAALHLDLGEVPARLALDYRVRVAGSAAPGTGVAVTLSTGF